MNILRWLAVLPMALLAALWVLVLTLFLGLLLPLPQSLEIYLTQLVGTTVLGPYYFVFIGSRTAPSKRPIVAVVLLLILGALAAFGVFGWFNGVRPESLVPGPGWWVITTAILTLTAGIFATIRVFRSEDETNTAVTDRRWQTPVLRVLAGSCSILWVYGYFGNAILFLVLSWNQLAGNWLSLLNPLSDLELFLALLSTWNFWALLAVTIVGYYGAQFFQRKLRVPQVVTPREELQDS